MARALRMHVPDGGHHVMSGGNGGAAIHRMTTTAAGFSGSLSPSASKPSEPVGFRIHHDSGRAGLAVGVDLGCHQAALCALEPQGCKGKKTAKQEEELTRPVE